MSRRVIILGATGSVGKSALDLIERSPDRFAVSTVTAQTKVSELADIAQRTQAQLAVIGDEALLPELRERLAGSPCRAEGGRQSLIAAAAAEADLVIAAIVGCAGLEPVMAAVEAGRTIALANKEALVTAGELMTSAAQASGATILPVDSEHNAIFQCLACSDGGDVSRIILTASGGPFRTASSVAMASATPSQAIAHPTWSMGAKISVDSATLMNKGLELIEAHFLFGLPSNRIDILVHPQSVIHSLVEFVDGSVLAQLGSPDMRIPIAYAVAWPDGLATPAERLDLAAIGNLAFEKPDDQRFPALRLARQALEQGGAAPIVLNAANEVAVEAFLGGSIRFSGIADAVAEGLQTSMDVAPESIADVLEIDRSTRSRVGAAMKASCG
jgi:1-deoxy-D-xylulose-5-phosphate reductoisomerase